MSTKATIIRPPAQDAVSDAELCFVYFGNDWFAENRTSSHHLARCLAEKFPVLYVEAPGFRAPKATGRDLKKIFKKLSLAFQKPRQLSQHMWHMTLPQIPFHKLRWVRRLNAAIGGFVCRRAMRHAGLGSPILWFVTPHVQHLTGRLGERLVVYYCIDDYAALPDIDRAAIGEMDRELTAKADQLFASARHLLDLKKDQNPTAVFSPHGVDVALFQKAADRTIPVAPGAENLAHPVIGFFGLVEAWFDIELVAEVAKARPDWTFLLIGRVASNIDALTLLPNVKFVGPVPYKTLPDWARAFDVAMIPFRRNELVMSVNPLKLREYLATGKPVVSTWMPEVERFSDCIGIANDPKAFEQEIEKALTLRSPEQEAARMRAVAGMTWEARMEEALGQTKRRLQEKINDKVKGKG
jgi:glycosyltransferase involved in cell wall biosynthesis